MCQRAGGAHPTSTELGARRVQKGKAEKEQAISKCRCDGKMQMCDGKKPQRTCSRGLTVSWNRRFARSFMLPLQEMQRWRFSALFSTTCHNENCMATGERRWGEVETHAALPQQRCCQGAEASREHAPSTKVETRPPLFSFKVSKTLLRTGQPTAALPPHALTKTRHLHKKKSIKMRPHASRARRPTNWYTVSVRTT